MRHPSRRWVGVLAAAVLVLSASDVMAASVPHLDGDDTSSHLDIRVSRLVRDHERHQVFVRLRMYDNYDLASDGSVLVYFDSRGGASWDLRARVFQGHFSSLCRLVNRRRAVSGCDWNLPSPRLTLSFPARRLRRNKTLRWRVVTRSRDGSRTDRAPDVGWYPR
jgi:hypothetical protein